MVQRTIFIKWPMTRAIALRQRSVQPPNPPVLANPHAGSVRLPGAGTDARMTGN